MCIKIPVKESSFDVTVRHISSLTSFSIIVELVDYFSETGGKADTVFVFIVYWQM